MSMAILLLSKGVLPTVFPHGYQLAFCSAGSSRRIPVGEQQEGKGQERAKEDEEVSGSRDLWLT